ncbi:MAG TPA: ATP-binding cassette domain-containing protein [Jatrophihabitans sp.]|nr:ATP-binding cassette domain-containing protein [Jatrophihabitans sp.]
MTARHAAVETEPAVAAEQVSYRRGGRTILDAVSVAAYPGEVLAVTGPSGSGKSSLLALLAGLELPDAGTVRRAAATAGVGVPPGYGLVLQGYGLVSVLTAAENVEVVLQAQRLNRNEVRDRAEDALAAVGLADVADHLVEQLSGGQQQRVAIARALVIEPAVLLADELTAELDHESRQRVLDRVFRLAEAGSTVVLCTHDPELAAACHREIRLTNGTITGSR